MKDTHSDPSLYDLLSTYAKWCGIHSKQQWAAYHDRCGCPDWVPNDPEHYFTQSGTWQGWPHFTGDKPDQETN